MGLSRLEGSHGEIEVQGLRVQWVGAETRLSPAGEDRVHTLSEASVSPAPKEGCLRPVLVWFHAALKTRSQFE